MSDWGVVAATARQQFGLITADQLRDLGLSPAAILWAVRSGRLERRHRGLFVLPGSAVTWRQRACEGLLLAGPAAVLSHDSAAHVWGLFGFERAPREIVVTVPRNRFARCLAGFRFRRSTTGARAMTVGGLRVTPVAQTLLDLAGTVDDETLEVALDSAHRRWPRVGAWIEALADGRDPRGVPGLTRLVEVVRERQGQSTESPLEVRVWRKLRRARGLKQPRLQHEVFDDAGYVMRVDFAWPAERVAVHADGYEWHDGRRQFDVDAEQRNRLQAAGWESLTVTTATLDTNWLEALRELLRTRAPQRTLAFEAPAWMP